MKLKPSKSGLDRLTLIQAERAGGSGRSARSYLDFAVNRQRISELVPIGDHIAVFGWLPRDSEKHYARQLLRREPSMFPSRHVPIYICPECADLGCGAITVQVTVQADCVVWSEIGWDSVQDASKTINPATTLRDLWFDKLEYENLIRGTCGVR